MALTYQPPFTQIPEIGLATLVAANTARDGSGTITTVFTAGTDGALIKRIKFIPAQATAAAVGAKVCCVFISKDAGTTWHFYQEVAMATSTPSTTVAAVASTQTINFPDGLVIDPNVQIGATITVYAGVQDRTQVILESGQY